MDRTISEPQQLLFSRVQVAKILGVSVATVQRIERMGKLTRIRLTDKPTSQVFFRLEEVMVLVEGNSDDE